jgi:Asp-tRNA(Asn)/Glu-tRNA(Gln) amidotransferase A subunit family amidase
MARFVPAVEYIKANRLRSQLIEDTHKALQDIDVLVAPSWVGSTLTLTNLTGHPCVVVPNALSKEQNSSISFIGQLFGEADALLVAKAYQEASKIHLQRPEGF